MASRALLGLVQLLLVLGTIAGVVLAVYRNDLLLGLARHAGKEAEFLRLEREHLGGAPWGTPRSQASLLAMLAQSRNNADTRSAAPLRGEKRLELAVKPDAVAKPAAVAKPDAAVKPDAAAPELRAVAVDSLPLAEEPAVDEVAVSSVTVGRAVARPRQRVTVRAGRTPELVEGVPDKRGASTATKPAASAATPSAVSSASKPAPASPALPVGASALKAAMRSAVVAEQ